MRDVIFHRLRALLIAWPLCILACGDGGVSPRQNDGPASVDAPAADASLGDGPSGVRSFERACDGFRLRLTILEDGVVRLRYLHRPEELPDRSWFFDLAAFAGPTSLRVSEDAERLRLATASLSIEIAGAACAVRITDA